MGFPRGALSRPSRRPNPFLHRQRRFQQPFPQQEQIHQGAGDANPIGVLEQSSITDLSKAKDPLHEPKWIRHLRLHRRLAPVSSLLGLTQGAMAHFFPLDELTGLGRHFPNRFPCPRQAESPETAVSSQSNNAPITCESCTLAEVVASTVLPPSAPCYGR